MRKILLLLCILSITISARAQLFGKNWKEGAYYDSVGFKHAGFISWDYKSNDISYKPEKKSDKVKVLLTQLKSFTMRNDSMLNDSFIVSKDKLFKKPRFLIVLLNQDTKIYSYSYTYFTAPMTTPSGFTVGGGARTDEGYFYGKDPDNLTKLDKKNFIEVMSQLLASKPYVVKRVKDKTFKFSKLEQLLYFYRTDNYPESMLNR